MTDGKMWAALAGLALVGGCYSGVQVGASGGADSESAGTAASGGDSDDSEGSGGESGGDAEVPELPQLVAQSGMRRLTRVEYVETVQDLTGVELASGASSLPSDDLLPFDNDYTTQAESASLIVAAESLAGEAAESLLADAQLWSAVVPCESAAVDANCFDSFVRSFGRRALRRPVTDDEATRWGGWMMDEAEAAGDSSLAISIAVRMFLQHPEFLYRVDAGEPTEDPEVVRLDDWAVASRLSFLLWGVGPDDALLDAAAAGRLGNPGEVEVEAVRMLADERAKERVQRFHAMWMGYEVMAIGGDLGESMRAETAALINRVVFDEEMVWQDLFRSEETFVDDVLAQHYGIEAPGNAAGDWVNYGESGRTGILSHGTFLSNGFKDGDTSPIVRGHVVSSMLLCLEVPEPPADVPPPPDPVEGACKIDEAAAHLTQASCAGCHAMLDTLGFGLENYDEFGQWRGTDPGKPECEIEGEGEVPGLGKFNGPGELGVLIADSKLLNDCLAEQAYRFAVGRTELDDVDHGIIERTMEELGEGDFEFKELLLQHVTDPSFGFARQHTEND